MSHGENTSEVARMEAPAAPVFIDGEKAMTLRGDNIAAEFHQIVEQYIDKRFGGLVSQV